LIYIRNCIDHTPDWVFILSNIASYARPGCELMIWNDIDHSASGADEGHYNITRDRGAFLRLIENFGFRIERQFDFHDRRSMNIGVFATKTTEPSGQAHFRYTITEGDPNRSLSLISD